MSSPTFHVATHGGAGSPINWTDGTDAALTTALDHAETDPVEAVCRAVASLEDDERFNAGTGSNLRSDGEAVELDAAVADHAGRFGAVAVVRGVRNPVLVARRVTGTPHILLAGEGATAFARRHGHKPWDPTTERARERFRRRRGEGPSDTVGAVAWTEAGGAAALSSGGTTNAAPGRVGDVPLPGCGLHVGPAGAVACTGHGEAIAARLAAYRVHGLLAEGAGPDEAVAEAVSWFPERSSFGLVVATAHGTAGASNRSMAWSHSGR